jgi:conjugal transfer pilus assembly protein TraB
MSNETLNNKIRQKRNWIIVGAIGAFLVTVLFFLTENDKPKKPEDVVRKSSLSQSIDSIEAEDLWREESANKLAQHAEKNEALQKEVMSLKQQMSAIQNNPTEAPVNTKSQEQLDYIIAELAQLKQKIQTQETTSNPSSSSNYMQSASGSNNSSNRTPSPIAQPQPGIYSYRLKLTERNDEPDNDKRVENYLPIGAFGKAVILGGVDASTSLSAQSDPRPVLMRLMDHGRLPKNIRSRIKDCHVIGAGYGDISSERVYVRLETISCTTKRGEVFEKPIHGYVAGEDGKDGIRGRVVWREGALIQRAFLAGTLGGIGQGIADTYVDTSVSPLGVVETVNTNDIFQMGLAQGGSNALNTLAEYNIQRAEAYQPVIEVEAGRMVEIVINSEGLYLRNPTLEAAEWTP